MIKLGSQEVTKIMKGSQEITTVYNGSDNVWSAQGPVDFAYNSMDFRVKSTTVCTGAGSASLRLSGNWYVEYWMKATQSQETMFLFDARSSRNESAATIYSEGGSWRLFANGDTIMNCGSLWGTFPNQWVHVVWAKKASGTVSVYRNGVRYSKTNMGPNDLGSSQEALFSTSIDSSLGLQGCYLQDLKIARDVPDSNFPYDPESETCPVPTGRAKATHGTTIVMFNGTDNASDVWKADGDGYSLRNIKPASSAVARKDNAL
jgi:hypothetical protein